MTLYPIHEGPVHAPLLRQSGCHLPPPYLGLEVTRLIAILTDTEHIDLVTCSTGFAKHIIRHVDEEESGRDGCGETYSEVL